MNFNQSPHLKKYEPSDNLNVSRHREFYSSYTSSMDNNMNHAATASALNFMLLGGFRDLMCDCGKYDSDNNDSDNDDEYDYEEMKETKSKLHKDLIDYFRRSTDLDK